MTAKRYVAGHANYRGDQSSLLGQLRGPTTYGSVVIATLPVVVCEHPVARPTEITAADATRRWVLICATIGARAT